MTEQAKNYQYSACQTEFSCDACQRQFTSRDTLNCHTDAHVKVQSEIFVYSVTLIQLIMVTWLVLDF